MTGQLLESRRHKLTLASGDYALSKAGQADGTGTQHPQPETIPHVTSPSGGSSNGIGPHASMSGTSPTGVSTSPIKASQTDVLQTDTRRRAAWLKSLNSPTRTRASKLDPSPTNLSILCTPPPAKLDDGHWSNILTPSCQSLGLNAHLYHLSSLSGNAPSNGEV